MGGPVSKEERPRPKCKTCIYRMYDYKRGCLFYYHMKIRRGCPAEECTRYVKGPKIKGTNDPAWSTKSSYDY